MNYPSEVELVGGPLCGDTIAWPRADIARLQRPIPKTNLDETVLYAIEPDRVDARGVGRALWCGMDRQTAFAE